jgi:hypothetical protein
MTDRFRENPDGILTDNENRIEWLPKDSYLDLGRWRNWKDANAYVMLMNSVYAGGHSNWRLPKQEEALGLYDTDMILMDYKGKELHIHPSFVPGCGFKIWTSDVNDEDKILTLNLRDGTTEYVEKTEEKFQSARLVRDIIN